MLSKIQEAWLNALEAILRPIAKLWMQSGLGYSQFEAVAKAVFVNVATNEYKARGRLPNYSQVSAVTGISRREVSRIRKGEPPTRWTPNMETSPVNTILHQWHFDPEFSDGDGVARPLPFEGPGSFSALVARYGGDIPPGAMRAALQKIGVLADDIESPLTPSLLYHYARVFDDDFVRRLAFALASLGSTLAHNAEVHQRTDVSNERKRVLGRLERAAWSEHLSREATLDFKAWVDQAVPRFLEDANKQIAERELPRASWSSNPPRAVGLGVYFFEED